MDAPDCTNAKSKLLWACAALALAVVGTLGSLSLSIGLGLKACPLCFYQRTFVMAVLAVLIVGLLVDRSQSDFLCLLCLPLAVGGLGVAAFHEYLVIAGKLECPNGLFGIGTAPLQSLILLVALAVCVGLGTERRIAAAAGGSALGLALAWACLASSPPMPPAPTKPYDQPPDVCRPPYRPS